MRVHRSRLVPMILLGLSVAVSTAMAAPPTPTPPIARPSTVGGTAAHAPKAPEVKTIGQGPRVLTALEVAKIEALARAFPQLGIRLPVVPAARTSFEAPTTRIEHFAPGMPRRKVSTSATVAPRDRDGRP